MRRWLLLGIGVCGLAVNALWAAAVAQQLKVVVAVPSTWPERAAAGLAQQRELVTGLGFERVTSDRVTLPPPEVTRSIAWRDRWPFVRWSRESEQAVVERTIELGPHECLSIIAAVERGPRTDVRLGLAEAGDPGRASHRLNFAARQLQACSTSGAPTRWSAVAAFDTDELVDQAEENTVVTVELWRGPPAARERLSYPAPNVEGHGPDDLDPRAALPELPDGAELEGPPRTLLRRMAFLRPIGSATFEPLHRWSTAAFPDRDVNPRVNLHESPEGAMRRLHRAMGRIEGARWGRQHAPVVDVGDARRSIRLVVDPATLAGCRILGFERLRFGEAIPYLSRMSVGAEPVRIDTPARTVTDEACPGDRVRAYLFHLRDSAEYRLTFWIPPRTAEAAGATPGASR